MSDPCPICAKHAGRGPLVGPLLWSDDLVVVSHRPVEPESGRGPLGYVFVETRRHVARWPDLSRAEALAVADAAWTAARALKRELGCELVFSILAGLGVAHFHQHVFVRRPDTPPDVAWTDSSTWPGAPTGDAAAVAALAGRLSRARSG